MTLGGLVDQVGYGGQQYGLGWWPATSMGREEVRATTELGAVTGSGIVLGVVACRADLFSQATFSWRRFGSAPRPMASDLFRTAGLAPVDRPVALLSRMELDVAVFGNAFLVRHGDVLHRLDPRWMTAVIASPTQPDNREASDSVLSGWVYAPQHDPDRAEVFFPGEVAHYAPHPSPDHRVLGMSYLTPVLRDVANHQASKVFTTRFWEASATPNSVVTFPPEVLESTVKAFAEVYRQTHSGAARAFQTAFLGGGAKLEAVGSGLADLDLSAVTAAVATEVCVAAGVPSVVLGATLGQEAVTTYNNYGSALRRFSDLRVRPLWSHAVRALAPLFPAPAEAELWYDVSGVAALQDDAADDAATMAQQATTIRTLVDGGYEPDSVKFAVTTGDLSKLVHTGNLSVQLLPAGASPTEGVAA